MNSFNTFLKYFNLKSRENEIDFYCKKSFNPPPFLLKKVFNLEKLDLDDKKEIEKYKIIYKKNCKELINKLLDKRYYKELIPLKYKNESGDLNYKKVSEQVLNSLFKSAERKGYGNSFVTTEGKKVIQMIFSDDKKDVIYAWAMLFTFMCGLLIESDFCDKYFIQNIFEIMPSEILKQKWLTKILLSQMSSFTILEMIKKYIKKYYNVPDNFFDGIVDRR